MIEKIPIFFRTEKIRKVYIFLQDTPVFFYPKLKVFALLDEEMPYLTYTDLDLIFWRVDRVGGHKMQFTKLLDMQCFNDYDARLRQLFQP